MAMNIDVERLEKKLKDAQKRADGIKPFEVTQWEPGLVLTIRAPTIDPEDEEAVSSFVVLTDCGNGCYLCAKMAPFQQMAGPWDYVLLSERWQGFSALIQFDRTEVCHETDMGTTALTRLPSHIMEEVLVKYRSLLAGEATVEEMPFEYEEFKDEEAYFMERLRRHLHEGWTGVYERRQRLFPILGQAVRGTNMSTSIRDPEALLEAGVSQHIALAAAGDELTVQLPGIRSRCRVDYTAGRVRYYSPFVPHDVTLLAVLYDTVAGAPIMVERGGIRTNIVTLPSDRYIECKLDLPQGTAFTDLQLAVFLVKRTEPQP